MRNIKMSKIGQFRNIIVNVRHMSRYVGQDMDDNPIYDTSKELPKLVFKGSVKIHGTNGSVCLSESTIYAQSKSRKITVEKDNEGFAFFVECNKSKFKEILEEISIRNEIDTDKYIITLYGEWAGKGIKKGVAISNLDKSFFIFGCKVSPRFENEKVAYWLDYKTFEDLDSVGDNIYNLFKFKTFEVEVDFNNPIYAQKQFEDITLQVEKQCPVSKELGFEGIGEGVVWTCNYKNQLLKFKTKGEKHSSSKVKRVASVDIDKMNNVMEFVEYSSTDNRFNQALKEVFNESEPTINKMGDLIRWVVNDINEEEIDTLKENKLTPKDVNKYLSNDVRIRFISYINKKLGL